MINILMISAEFSPYQPTPTRVSMLARASTHQGHRVILLSNSGRDACGMTTVLKNLIPRKSEVEGVTWIFPPVVRTGIRSGSLRAMEGLFSILSTIVFGAIYLLPYIGTIEVIYSSTAQSQGLIGSFLKTILRRPLVVNYGDPAFVRDIGFVRKTGRLLEAITFSRSDLIFSVDPVIAEYVQREYGKSTMFLPNGYEAAFRRKRSRKRSRSHKIITFLGKLDLSIYRLDVLLNALRTHRERFRNNARLRLIGIGPDKAGLEFLARQLGIEKSIEFIGPVPHHEVPRWLADSEICVHITNDMCTGIKVSEYMAANKPVIIAAPWWNKYNRFLQNGVNCVMVPLDAKKLADAIDDLLARSSYAKRLAAQGFKTISYWTWDNIAGRKMSAIAELLRAENHRKFTSQ